MPAPLRKGQERFTRPCRGFLAELLLLLPPFFHGIEEKILLAHLLPQLVPFTAFLAKFNLIFSAALVRLPT